jgi:hypothetical protein
LQILQLSSQLGHFLVFLTKVLLQGISYEDKFDYLLVLLVILILQIVHFPTQPFSLRLNVFTFSAKLINPLIPICNQVTKLLLGSLALRQFLP